MEKTIPKELERAVASSQTENKMKEEGFTKARKKEGFDSCGGGGRGKTKNKK